MAQAPDVLIIQRFLCGELSREEVVELMLAIPDSAAGLAITLELEPDQRRRLEELGEVLPWEMARRDPQSRVPNVPYGSDEYYAFRASVPRVVDGGAA